MKNELLSLQSLFKETLFRIPDYQRWYSWWNLQLEEFRSDAINLLPWKEHYTWMLSLKELWSDYTKNWNDEKWLIEDRSYKAYHIVDWQQRLTTFIILINEIVNYYIKINPWVELNDIIISSNKLSDIIKEYLYDVKPWSSSIIKTYKFWYEVDNPSYEFFKQVILESQPNWVVHETFYTLNLLNAKNFFEKKIEELVDNHWLDSLENLYKKVTQKMVFNIYEINDDFNVFIAFETMNNRWKRLSTLELLKNRLIYLSTLFGAPEDEEKALRDQINDTWKTIYSCLWKNKSKPLNDDEFLQAHWMIYFWYTRSNWITFVSDLLNRRFTQQSIFNESFLPEDCQLDVLGENFDDSDVEIEDWEETNNSEIVNKAWLTMDDVKKYIDSLKELIPFWYSIHFPDDWIDDNNCVTYLKRLNRLWFWNFKPLTTVILSRKDLSNEEKAKAFKAMERFVFLHYRLDWYFWTYKNSFFYNLARDFYFEIKWYDEVLSELNNIANLSTNNVINTSWVLTKFSRLFSNYDGFYSWWNIRYFLYEYERFLMTDKWAIKILPEDFFKKDEKDHVSIEHIYPQHPEDISWKQDFEWYDNTQKSYLTDSLWNLLPLSKNINSKLQNDPFENKKHWKERWYDNWSYNEIEVSRYDKWTPEEILDRWMKMIDFMEKEWNFVFPNNAERKKFLWLDFMIKDWDENKNRTDPESSPKNRSSAKIAMTDEMVRKAYEEGKKVIEWQIKKEEAIKELESIGMNPSSADMYLIALSKMLAGENFKMNLNYDCTEYYIKQIRKDYWIESAIKACDSLESHIAYLQSFWHKAWKFKELLKRERKINNWEDVDKQIKQEKLFDDDIFNDLLSVCSENIKNIYKKLDQYMNVLNIHWDHVTKYTTRDWVRYMKWDKIFLIVNLNNDNIRCSVVWWFDYKDPWKYLHYNRQDGKRYTFYIKSDSDLEVTKWLIKQSFDN